MVQDEGKGKEKLDPFSGVHRKIHISGQICEHSKCVNIANNSHVLIGHVGPGSRLRGILSYAAPGGDKCKNCSMVVVCWSKKTNIDL